MEHVGKEEANMIVIVSTILWVGVAWLAMVSHSSNDWLMVQYSDRDTGIDDHH